MIVNTEVKELNADSVKLLYGLCKKDHTFLESFPIYLNGNPEGNVDWYTIYEGSNIVIHAEKY